MKLFYHEKNRRDLEIVDNIPVSVHGTSVEEETAVSITPNKEKWLTAAALPVTVIVGLEDLEYQPDRTGQKGNARIVIARNWVNDMHEFAATHNVDSQIELSIVPNQHHSSTGLMPFCQDALLQFENIEERD